MATTFTAGEKAFIKCLGMEHTYPGLRLRWEGMYDRGFAQPERDTPEVIEIFGADYVVLDADELKKTRGANPMLQHDVVAILHGKECGLFTLLQWRGPFRHHPDVGMARLFTAIMWWVALFALHLVALLSYTVWTGNFPLEVNWEALRVAGAIAGVSVVFPVAEILLASWLHEQWRYLIATVRIHLFLFRLPVKRANELLSDLTNAGNKDIATEARRALGLLHIYT